MSEQVVLPELKNLGQLLFAPISSVVAHQYCQRSGCYKPTKFEITSNKKYKGRSEWHFACCNNQKCADWIVKNRIEIMDI